MAYEHLKKLQHGDNPAHLIIVSFRQLERTFGGEPLRIEPRLSFVSIGERIAVEWAPPSGPIQVFTRAVAGEPHPDGCGFGKPAIEHYLFPHIWPNGLDWAQGAVNELQLPESALRGDWDWVFSMLDRFRTGRENEVVEDGF